VTRISFVLFFVFAGVAALAQAPAYTHADSLKGCITKERAWWDVLHYDLHVSFHPEDSSIAGYNKLLYRVLESYHVLQADLIEPMMIDSVVQDGRARKWMRNGNAFFISLEEQALQSVKELTIYFHGRPHRAKMPPWDGGVIWSRDKKNNPWISIACQGMSASVWFPNKDHQYDEVDSASVHITAPKQLVTVANGRLRSKKINNDGTATYYWAVVNPINNYNIIPYIGKYVNFKDTLHGKAGILDLDFWVLEENLAVAQKQFLQSKPMLHCFEDWFGPYPFYEDGYKLVEAPFLGMEHQSAIAYGNKFQNGYKGLDLSLSGWGLKWDFIIIHESGHEWFANSITARDVADNWIHEGFTAYSENLYTEYLFGKKAGSEYVIGTRKAIQNDKPIIGDYNVNRDGSGDMYYKGANMLHTIRQLVNNDSLWKECLRGLNKTFYHQTVTTKQIEDYMSLFLGINLQKIFDQYLRTVLVPLLEYRLDKKKLAYRWTNCVAGFNMPLKLDGPRGVWLKPTESWQTIHYASASFSPDPNFYIKTKKVK
jgi:aminopeptidase N